MKAISLDTAMVVTGISKRTLWRRLTDGVIARMANDARGRAMLAVEDLLPLLRVPIEPEGCELLIRADRGDVHAQNDLALLFLEADQPAIALHWLSVAAESGQPDVSADAMHNLALLYIEGSGVPRDENLGLMWLAKAAAHGHVIARKQMAALTQRAVDGHG